MSPETDRPRGDEERLPDLPGPAPVVPLVVHVGDQIRFSTSLLRQIDDGPYQLVEIERIIREPDGTLTLYLKRAESAF